MTRPGGDYDWRGRKLREWLLLLLRLAITQDPQDRTVVLAAADELDSLGASWRPEGPTFFYRNSLEISDAILAGADEEDPVLRRHIARIEDARLRRAFAAALRRPRPTAAIFKGRERRLGLWKGLPER